MEIIHTSSQTNKECQSFTIFLSNSKLYMALFTWKMKKWKYGLQDYASQGSSRPRGLCLWVMWEWCSSISETEPPSTQNLPMLLGWNWNWAHLSRFPTEVPWQTHQPFAAPPATTNREQGLSEGLGETRWQVTHLLGQVSTVEVPGFRRKAKKLSSWFRYS